MKIPVLVNKIVKAVCTTLLVLGMSPVLTMAQNAGFSASQMLEELNTNLGQARELESAIRDKTTDLDVQLDAQAETLAALEPILNSKIKALKEE